MNDYKNTAEYYDYIYKLSPAEFKFYKSFINPFKRVLEMGCGTGRLTIELALNTYWKSYDCVDISEPMLKVLKGKIETRSGAHPFLGKLNIHQSDMRTFNTNEKYDVIIYSFQSIQCMSRNEIKEQIKISESLLKKNGILIISTFDPKIGYIENSEHLNAISTGRNQEMLLLVDRDFKHSAEYIEYTEDLKVYNNYCFHQKTISDEFKIGNVDHDYIKSIHMDSALKFIGFYSDYAKTPVKKDDKFYINVYKKTV